MNLGRYEVTFIECSWWFNVTRAIFATRELYEDALYSLSRPPWAFLRLREEMTTPIDEITERACSIEYAWG